ncbi:hypothetical protein D3C85_1512110 [compost metagenome]
MIVRYITAQQVILPPGKGLMPEEGSAFEQHQHPPGQRSIVFALPANVFAQVRVQRQRVTAEFSLVAFSRMADGPDKVADLAQYVVQTTRRQTAVMHDEDCPKQGKPRIDHRSPR